MASNIKVNVDELIEKLKLISDDEYNTVKIEIGDAVYEGDKALKIIAIDTINDREIEYGEVQFDSGEF